MASAPNSCTESMTVAHAPMGRDRSHNRCSLGSVGFLMDREIGPQSCNPRFDEQMPTLRFERNPAISMAVRFSNRSPLANSISI